MSYKTKSLLYFASFVIATITYYYNVSASQRIISDVNELAKADVEQITIETMNQNIQ
ncbi:hypothetical protein ACEZ3G_08965 [Maribacter algicola]|uniref:Uncharacterized protein n=1 Tax=Meishania litoralis TaxID=3434685 RepID=A0ACC7LJ66_9FLAO